MPLYEERLSKDLNRIRGEVDALGASVQRALEDAVQSALTGNAVLYKPSEFATLTGLAIADLLQEAGVPSAVFRTLVGAGDLGAKLVEVGPDGLFFTGSHATGVRIAQAYAGHLGVLQSVQIFINRKNLFVEGLCFLISSPVIGELCQVIKIPCHRRVLLSISQFINGKGLLIEQVCPVIVAETVMEQCKIAQTDRYLGMFPAVYLFINGKCTVK